MSKWSFCTWTMNIQMFKLDFEKADKPEIKLPTSTGSWKKQESSRKNIYFCFIDYSNKALCVDHNKLWKVLQKMGISDHRLICTLRNLHAGQEALVKTGHGTTDWFQIRKGVCQGYIWSPCLTSLQSTSCGMLGWMKHKLELRLPGEISITSNDTTVMAEREGELQSLLMKVKEESEKIG